MTDNTLPDLTDREKNLMYDPEIFPLKFQVNDKLLSLFNAIGIALKDKLIDHHFFQSSDIQFRISKGENYLQFPYIILDIPQLSAGSNLICLRCMFWYGHYFSLSLLLKGKPAYAALPALSIAAPQLKNWQFSFANDPWLYCLEDALFTEVSAVSFTQMKTHLDTYHYIKLMRKIKAGNLNEIKRDFLKYGSEIITSISGSTNTLG